MMFGINLIIESERAIYHVNMWSNIPTYNTYSGYTRKSNTRLVI